MYQLAVLHLVAVSTSVSKAAKSAAKQTKEAEELAKEQRAEHMGDDLTQLLAQMNDPQFAETLEQTLAALSGGGEYIQPLSLQLETFPNINLIINAGDAAALNNLMNPVGSGSKGKDSTPVIDGDIAKTLQVNLAHVFHVFINLEIFAAHQSLSSLIAQMDILNETMCFIESI